MDWLDLLAVQGTLKSLLQHHSSKASILQRSAFFIVQLSHPYMTTGKTIALTKWTFVGKVMSLLLNMLSRLLMAFLPFSRRGKGAPLPCGSWASYRSGFSYCEAPPLGARPPAVVAHGLSCPQHVGSSSIRIEPVSLELTGGLIFFFF